MFLELLLVPTITFAQKDAKITAQAPREETTTKKPGDYDLSFELELRAASDRRDNRPTNRSKETVHELALGGRYQFDESVGATLELALEQLGNESTFFAKQAYIEWEPWTNTVQFDLGQQFLPVGLINERDNLFSSNPPFMRTILGESKGIDLGAVTRISPLQNPLIYIEAGAFAGRLVRPEDQRSDTPKTTPRLLSLKSESEYHTAFGTYFEHDLAQFDPLKAYGAGFELRSPEWRKFRASLLSEYWTFRQDQARGPDQENRALLIWGELRWWRLSAGHRWSESRGQIIQARRRDELPIEVSRLSYFGIDVSRVFSLRAERVIETQSQTLRNEWIGRARLNWEL